MLCTTSVTLEGVGRPCGGDVAGSVDVAGRGGADGGGLVLDEGGPAKGAGRCGVVSHVRIGSGEELSGDDGGCDILSF